ncbi:Protein CBG25736 [Caenorhabditis briggsae]|uniref:Protein CBG25736 n=3 Tax=Caenorhabditis briggsae TaxID=6238 RepID=B6IHQ7_CAEBR|nr:Protein CBG25736 [Caenorhabditis briggsae]ULT85106.1 hypothetical protein L3Y34_013662 [Caenorhabditis briggsae]CAR99437.1 Protein CBG25736 [Caenorhabditis briggsae]
MQPEAKRGRILDPVSLARRRSSERDVRHYTTQEIRRQAAARDSNLSRKSSRGGHQSGANSRGGHDESRKSRSMKKQRDRERRKSRSSRSANRSSSVDPGYIPHATYHNSYESDVASYKYGIQSSSFSKAPPFDHHRYSSEAPPFDRSRLSSGDRYGHEADYVHHRKNRASSEAPPIHHNRSTGFDGYIHEIGYAPPRRHNEHNKPVFKHPGDYFSTGRYNSANDSRVATYKHGLPSAENAFDPQMTNDRHGFSERVRAYDLGQYGHFDSEAPRGRARDRRSSSMDNAPRGHGPRGHVLRGYAPRGQAERGQNPKIPKKFQRPCRPLQIAPDYERVYAARRTLCSIPSSAQKPVNFHIKLTRPLTERQDLVNKLYEAFDYRSKEGETWEDLKRRVLEAERELMAYEEQHQDEEKKKRSAVIRARLIRDNPGCDQPGYRRRSRSRSWSCSPNKRYKDIFEF